MISTHFQSIPLIFSWSVGLRHLLPMCIDQIPSLQGAMCRAERLAHASMLCLCRSRGSNCHGWANAALVERCSSRVGPCVHSHVSWLGKVLRVSSAAWSSHGRTYRSKLLKWLGITLKWDMAMKPQGLNAMESRKRSLAMTVRKFAAYHTRPIPTLQVRHQSCDVVTFTATSCGLLLPWSFLSRIGCYYYCFGGFQPDWHVKDKNMSLWCYTCILLPRLWACWWC